jgi:hypothetical protein
MADARKLRPPPWRTQENSVRPVILHPPRAEWADPRKLGPPPIAGPKKVRPFSLTLEIFRRPPKKLQIDLGELNAVC